jgi:dolichyl-phosphate beta-glucosyltransferase
LDTLARYTSVIIIPCYNERARLQADSFVDHLKLHQQHAFCFVDDGSTDDTRDLLLEIQQKCENAFCVLLDKNGGKAHAVYEGFQYALTEIPASFYGYMDADLATPLSFIQVLEKEFASKTSLYLVFGSRQLAEKGTIERKLFRHYSGRLVSSLITWSLKKKFGDTQCGAKLFSKQGAILAFNKPFISTWIFDVEILKRLLVEFELGEANQRISEIPVTQWKDVGNSKVSPLYFFRMCGELMKIRGIRK